MANLTVLKALNLATRQKAARTLSTVDSRGGWWPMIREPFTGAWQRNMEVEATDNILTFSAVYSCITLIAGDISKMRIKLTRLQDNGTWKEVMNSPFAPVLRKPNRYQTRMQFIEHWVTSKLIHGNTYALKDRDQRGVVARLYLLDPCRVTPLVAPDGSVWYQLAADNLSVIGEQVTVPASEIIHDRMNPLFHPLVGVSPIRACAASSTQGMRIQTNAARFFENMSRPSGILTAPGAISDETAKRLKEHWEANYSGSGLGRVAVLGDGLAYAPMSIPATDAQLIEQLKWTVEDVARCFHVPLHMVAAGQGGTYNNEQSRSLSYLQQCLQTLIENIESLLDDGLGLANDQATELDVDVILRMDAVSRADANQKAIQSGYLAPNEARLRENLPPVPGGEAPYLQQQNWSLEQLANRKPPTDAPAPPQERSFGGPSDYLNLLERIARLEAK
jgi:HK97 family phage portal protein